jgi:hypothetical protein
LKLLLINMLVGLIWVIVKYVGMALAGLVVYVGYVAVLKPYMFRRKYMGVDNVYVTTKFNPLFGDLKEMIDHMHEGKVMYYSYKTDITRFKGYDMQARLDGINPVMMMLSGKAVKEFLNLQPTIDKKLISISFGKMVPNSYAVGPSDKITKDRRKAMMNLLGLNNASKYIGIMLDSAQLVLNTMCKQDQLDFKS